MRNVLIVSPRFPPVNTPDMQRVRLSLPHLESCGWRPVVLSVQEAFVEGPRDPLLKETVPGGVAVTRAGALPRGLTRLAGVGDLGLRSFGQLYRQGCRLIEEQDVHLVYFSTTVFSVMPLGRLWKRRYGVPFVIDLQDPWVAEPSRVPPEVRGPKAALARRLHRLLEGWTMRRVDGLLAVSEPYLEDSRRRCPRLQDVPTLTLPFAAAASDFELLARRRQPNRFFQPGRPDRLNVVYAGRGGSDMAPALELLFGALQRGLREQPGLFGRLRLYFVGTDYAADGRRRKTVEPHAVRFGLGPLVREVPERQPYFETLQLLRDADLLLVPGSRDPAYTASKIYPYVQAARPLLAVFHERSSVVGLLRSTGAGEVVTFGGNGGAEAGIGPLLEVWRGLLERLPFTPATRWDVFEAYSARTMTRRQCRLFDAVCGRSRERSR